MEQLQPQPVPPAVPASPFDVLVRSKLSEQKFTAEQIDTLLIVLAGFGYQTVRFEFLVPTEDSELL